MTEKFKRHVREQTIAALGKAPVWIAVAQTDEQWRFIGEMSALFRDLPTVYVNLGSPYRTVNARHLVSVLTYSSSPESQQASADVITGFAEALGVLPVTPLATPGNAGDNRP